MVRRLTIASAEYGLHKPSPDTVWGFAHEGDLSMLAFSRHWNYRRIHVD